MQVAWKATSATAVGSHDECGSAPALVNALHTMQCGSACILGESAGNLRYDPSVNHLTVSASQIVTDWFPAHHSHQAPWSFAGRSLSRVVKMSCRILDMARLR